MASSRLVPITLAIVVLAAAGGGYYYYQRNHAAEQAPVYNTTTVSRGSIRQVVTATGALDAVLSVDVGSQISGLIVKLYADFNTIVKKGQKLVEIDPATYEQRLRQAEANLASAVASNKLQSLNTDRTRALYEKSLVTKQDLDQAEAQLAQSNAQLQTSRASVENAKVDLERCTINSPIDGIVIAKQTEEGKTVAASLNAPVLFTIANDLSKMQITAAVAEADIGSVQQNQPVTFTVDAFPNRSFSGVVTQVRNAPKTVSNVVTYDTIISVDNKDLKLRPGMTANVSIIVASRENTLRIPNSALRVRLPDTSGTPVAATAAANPGAPEASAGGASSGAGGERRNRGASAGAEGGERRPREGGSNAEGGGRRGGGGFMGAEASPEQREKMRAVMAEVGITNFREATSEQREQFRKLLVERGLAPAPAAPGESVVSTRTIYRLPGGNKEAKPEPVSVKIGITDGIASELIEGAAEGDVIVTGILSAPGTPTAGQPAANPFGGGRRF